MMRYLCHISACVSASQHLSSEGGREGWESREGICAPVEMLRRVELLDERLGLRRPRGAGDGEGLAAQDLGVVDAEFWGEDLVAQAGL